jgi:DNA replication factor GINS
LFVEVEIRLYEEIFEAWKREKNSGVIQPLPASFFEKASEYLSNLKLLMSKQIGEAGSEPLRKREVEYIEFMLSSLLKMRAKKIAALSLEDTTEISANLLAREVSLVEDLRGDFKEYVQQCTQLPLKEKGIIGSVSEKEKHAAAGMQETPDTMLLRILQPMPKLVGVDLEEYGPFQQEDLVVLPKENALVLIARGVASEVKPEKIQ